jgi:tRNA threonylcarbamoyladenosine biosynthesis protein TsaE
MSEHAVVLHAASLVDTHAIATAIAHLSRPGDIIVLAGEMGAGKTAFAQGFGHAIGVTDRITSPTFTLVHSYPIDSGPRAGKVTLHHADLYRLERTAEVADLALRELADFNGIVLVEWGDVVDLFGDHLVVHLDSYVDDDLDAAADDGEVDVGDADPHADDVDRGPDEVLRSDERRRVELGAVGSSWAGRWGRLLDAVSGYTC